MSERVFVDTNVLVYTLDGHDVEKRERARKMLCDLTLSNAGVVSTQVLQEFYVTATRKLKLAPIVAKTLVRFFENFEVVTIDPPLIREAVDCAILSRISFWDALIVVAAEAAKCEQLATDDLNDGQVIRGVRVVDPFGK